MASSPAAPPAANARPIDEGERLVLLDTLRGFALCGVFMANVYLWFSGRMFLSRAQMEASLKDASWLDTAVNQAFGPLIGGRFITLFAFLFGLGFAVQLRRAEWVTRSLTYGKAQPMRRASVPENKEVVNA